MSTTILPAKVAKARKKGEVNHLKEANEEPHHKKRLIIVCVAFVAWMRAKKTKIWACALPYYSLCQC